MFENMNPLDRPTAFLEITILLLVSFIIGFIAARIQVDKFISSKKKSSSKNKTVTEEEIVDPRDIITEPTSIRAVLTRDRKGNAISEVKKDVPAPKKGKI